VIHTIVLRSRKKEYDVYSKINQDFEMLFQKCSKIHYIGARRRGKKKYIFQMVNGISLFLRLFFVAKINDYIICYYPFEKIYTLIILFLKKIKGIKTAVIIEDVNFIRYGQDRTDAEYIKGCKELQRHDVILAQSSNFIKKMQNDISSIMISFDVFPFGIDKEKRQTTLKTWNKENIKICYIGNLRKAPFLMEVAPQAYKMYLCGTINEELLQYVSSAVNINYIGEYIDNNTNGNAIADYDFGLVWDGNNVDIEKDTTGLGQYLRYSAPYKFSNYLANGLPVIVWENSAMAEFVEKNNVGICIKNVLELEQLKNLSAKEYSVIRENAIKISERIVNGEDFMYAIEKITKFR
jgi:hypothetical protein